MVVPHFRHQSSLEGFIDFSSPQILDSDLHNKATDIFNQIITQYEPSQTEDEGFKWATLLRVTHEFMGSKDNFLSYFFIYAEMELWQGDDKSEPNLSEALLRYASLDSWSREKKGEFKTCLITFADYLVQYFFLPCKLYVFYI